MLRINDKIIDIKKADAGLNINLFFPFRYQIHFHMYL